MLTRVFFFFALILCACGSGKSELSEGDSDPQSFGNAEIVDVVEYHPDGTVKLKGKTQNGKRIGKWEAYYPSGYKWSEAIYRNGQREGDAITYYPNGMMRYQGRYYDNEKTGIWMFYDTLGVLIERVDMDEVSDKSKFFRDSKEQP